MPRIENCLNCKWKLALMFEQSRYDPWAWAECSCPTIVNEDNIKTHSYFIDDYMGEPIEKKAAWVHGAMQDGCDGWERRK